MAGRGRAPVTLTPEFIEALRHRYVETGQPVRDIIAEFGISLGRLNRLIEECRWPKRQDQPPRQLPPALRLLEETRLLGEQRSGALSSSRHPEVRAKPASKDDGHDEAEFRPHPSRLAAEPPLAPQDDGDGAETAAARIELLVMKELAAEEAVRARLGSAPRGVAEAERTARTLSILTQTLQNLQRLRAAGAAAGDFGKHQFDDDTNDDMPADLDEFRRELARRIEAFVASQPDDGDAADDHAQVVAPARS
jgi:hypothetical protein